MATYTTPYRSFNVTSTFNVMTDVYNVGSTGVSFDFSGIPAGSTINSAKLYLSHNQASTYIRTFSVNGSSYYSGMNVAAQVGGSKIYTFRFASRVGTETRTISVSSARIVVDYTPDGGGGDYVPPSSGWPSPAHDVYFDTWGTGPDTKTLGPNKLANAVSHWPSDVWGFEWWYSENTTSTASMTFYKRYNGSQYATLPSSPNNGTSRYWRVVTVAGQNPESKSTYSTEYITLKTHWTNPSTPSTPTLSENNVTPSKSVTLSWGASSSGTNNALTGYIVERSTNNSTWSVLTSTGTSTRSITVTAHATNGSSYYYRVRGAGEYSDGSFSGSVQLKTVVSPLAAPTGVAIGGATAKTVSPSTATSITWNAVSSGTNNAVTGYEIHTSSSSSTGYTRLATVGSTVHSYAITAPTAEGTKYYKVLAVGAQVSSPLSAYASLTVSLTTSDAATFSVSPSNVVAGNDTTIAITSNADKIQKYTINFGNASSGEQTIAAGVSSATYTIPMSWCNQIPNATVGTATITVDTYVGSTLKGRRTSTFYVSVPSSVVPTLASFTGTRVDNSVPATWGVYVVSKSQVALAMGNGSGAYGSTITGYRLFGGGLNLSQATPISATSPVLSSTATTFTATVTDSRNRSSSYVVSVTALDYSAPTIATTSFRCNSSGVEDVEGTYGSAKVVSAFASVGSRNSVTITARYRVKGSAGVWTNIGTLTNNTATVFGGGNLAQNSYYEVEYTVVDQLGVTVKYVDDISTSQYIMHYKPGGKGLGIGGAWSDDETLDVHWDAKFRRGIDVLGDIKQNGQPLSFTPESIGALPATGTAVDADKLDGKHGSEYAASNHSHNYLDIYGGSNYYSKYLNTSPANDFNTITNSLSLTAGANGPFSSYAYLQNFIYSNANQRAQLAISYASNPGRMAFRTLYDGVWRGWYEILHNGNYLNYVYPVGAIYMSLTSTSPATLFGGTWAAIGAGTFLVAAGTGYAAGATGGAATHAHTTTAVALTIAQMPSHTHILPHFRYGSFSSSSYSHIISGSNAGTHYENTTAATGSGQAHGHGNTGSASSLPPYYAVYMWRRTA